MDVCLLYMPYGSIDPPPLGISALVAAGKRAGLAVRALYPSFWFAEKIGYLTYNAISVAIGGPQAAEWTFSRAAFPDFRRRDADYLRRYLKWERAREGEKYSILFSDEESFKRKCREVRSQAEAFIPETVERILELEPKIVGCSSIYYQNCASLAVLRRLKELRPGIVTLMGGANCEGEMGMAMKRSFPWVDFVVSGEADEIFPALCRRLLEDGGKAPEEELPAGVIGPRRAARGGEPPVAMVEPLDGLAAPDYGDFLGEVESFRYRSALPPLSLSVEMSRGCWWGQRRKCTFCGVNGQRTRYRAKPPGRVLEELDELHRRHGVENFLSTDNILDRSSFATILPRLADPARPRYSFFTEIKSNLSQEQCRLLRAAGFTRMQPGIESLHDALLGILNKGSSAAGNVALLKYAFENGIKLTWIALVDIPGERDEWYAETAAWLPAISHLQPPCRIKPIRFDRFSDYHRRPAHYGLSLAPLRWYRDIYPLPPERIEGIAYHFEDRKRRGRKPGPGKEAFVRALLVWMRLFTAGAEPPRLTVKEGEKTDVVTDTRPGASGKETRLAGLPRLVLRACHRPRRRKELMEEIAAGGAGDGAAEAALASLEERRLLLELGGRLISPALRLPLTPFAYRPDYTFPGLRAAVGKDGKSYWEILEALERRMAARHFWTALEGIEAGEAGGSAPVISSRRPGTGSGRGTRT